MTIEEYRKYIQTHYSDEPAYICSICRQVDIHNDGQVRNGHWICNICYRDKQIHICLT